MHPVQCTTEAPTARTHGQWTPRVRTQCMGGCLIGEISPTARSLAVALPALDSTRHFESTSALGWLRGSPELARQRPWQTAQAHNSAIAVSGNAELA